MSSLPAHPVSIPRSFSKKKFQQPLPKCGIVLDRHRSKSHLGNFESRFRIRITTLRSNAYFGQVYTVGYVIGQIPSNLLLTRVSPRWVIPMVCLPFFPSWFVMKK